MTHPVMAGQHEVISTPAAIPERVLVHENIHVIAHKKPQRVHIARLLFIQIGHHHGHTEGQEIDVGLVWIRSQKRVVPLQLLNEPALNGVNLLAGSVVHQRLLPFRVHVDLKPPLHLPVAPALSKTLDTSAKRTVKFGSI